MQRSEASECSTRANSAAVALNMLCFISAEALPPPATCACCGGDRGGVVEDTRWATWKKQGMLTREAAAVYLSLAIDYESAAHCGTYSN